jgi:ankyrin repeat protein
VALASSKGKVEVARFLIGQGVDVNARDNNSWAPLHFAAQDGHLDVVQPLLDHSADKNIREHTHYILRRTAAA